MYNCIILGSGRSGTSMAAGLLAKSGYFMGNNLIPPRPANPKGFFESAQINRDINEVLMRPLLPEMVSGHGWLKILPYDTLIPKNATAVRRIKTMVAKQPFCYKDPRFCYTLPAWIPHVPRTKILCVFRHPASTATSIVRECNTAKYLRALPMDIPTALRIWCAMYGRIVHTLRSQGSWMFVHYNQLFEKDTLDEIKGFLELDTIDYSFPEKRLIRPQPDVNLTKNATNLYTTLCELSNR